MDSTGDTNRAPVAGRAPAWNGEECKRAFSHAAGTKPWTVGYASCNEDELRTNHLPLSGNIPAGLRGTFYRNGPARHERGAQRYGHRWDGDGMVQAFRIGAQVSHHGRFVQTAKYVAETAAGRFLRNAFGTYIPGTPPVPDDIDESNVANISLCMAGADLLALWEPGSAYRIDPHTLETIGVRTWSHEFRGRPFSAHPKLEPDGTLWNFGANPLTGELTLYCIGTDGALKRSETLRVDKLPNLHDFAVTDRHLVFLLPPMPVNKEKLESGVSFAQACEWIPGLGTRVLVVSKADWSQRWYELPSGFLFHVANAWEDTSGVIRLQFMGASSPISFVAGWSTMQGMYKHRPGAFMTLVELDPRAGATQIVVEDLEGEFPAVDPLLVGRKCNEVLCLGRSKERGPDIPGFDELVNFDVDKGSTQRYSYGSDWLVEEHLLVADASAPAGPAEWVVGTALNVPLRKTVVSVFRADSIADGPVAQASLPYALPLGLHGLFVPSRD